MGYGRTEADFLYCLALSLKLQKIVQIGAGVSTSILLRARDETGIPPENHVNIQPYRNEFKTSGRQLDGSG